MILAIIIVFLTTISYVTIKEIYKIITKNILKLFKNYDKRRYNL